MNEHPILFNGEMVKAILSGRKTQTRRPMKNYVPCDKYINVYNDIWVPTHNTLIEIKQKRCPFGVVGDRLWVRERHARTESVMTPVYYFADGHYPTIDERHDAGLLRSYPSIHMPRWASRITLEVVSVRVERLQDISMDDACAEGITLSMPQVTVEYGVEVEARACFSELWDSINCERGYGWDSNPFVWVCEFKVL